MMLISIIPSSYKREKKKTNKKPVPKVFTLVWTSKLRTEKVSEEAKLTLLSKHKMEEHR